MPSARRPPLGVLVQAFFVGMLGNLLPMPGGVGGVEGGMIATLVAFDVNGGLAVVAVLVYRAFTFWLPLVPGLHRLLPAAKDDRPLGRGAPCRAHPPGRDRMSPGAATLYKVK